VELADFLVTQFDDTVARHRGQVLDLVPAERQKERMPGGNSISWATYHVARHASLALSVLDVRQHSGHLLDGFEQAATAPGSGLQEVEQDWNVGIPADHADAYAAAVFADVRAFLRSLTPTVLDARVDVAGGLRAAGVDETVFGWLYRMWDQPVAFLVGWPLTGHVTNHVGEMIATRNQMGLSPFR
jgi:hypothetical protein